MKVTALVLAGGQGTRMKSDMPKVAHRVLGVPLVKLVVNVVRAAGIDDIVVVTGHCSDHVDALIPSEVCVLQEEQLGTGHAVMCALPALEHFSGSLVVVSGDAPLLLPETILALLGAHEAAGAAVTILTARMPDPNGYGRIVRDEDGGLAAIIEQKDLAPGQETIDEINAGTYCFDKAALVEHLRDLKNDNAQGELYLTDMVRYLHGAGLPVASVLAEDPSQVIGVNTRVQLAEASRLLQKRINVEHMLAGVTMIQPDLVWVAPGVTLGRDVILEPMTTLLGDTHVAAEAHIGPNTRLTDTRVGERARVDSSVVIDAEIGPDAMVGPMAYIRPGAVLHRGAKVGTFVEIKNSTVGEGSKVPHLSYMGDATIGAGVNVGAGSITCNYDGFQKHATEIEDGVFLGSDTMLVAPVRIGEGAVVGAGSVITKDVPPGALAVERSEQRHVEGWATARRDAARQGDDRRDQGDDGQ